MNNAVNKKSISLDDICELIEVKSSLGDMGIKEHTETTREVFCGRLSVNMNEFYKANQSGLKPDLCICMDWEEYREETKMRYNSTLYVIYRVYERGDGLIELYCTEKVGVTDG